MSSVEVEDKNNESDDEQMDDGDDKDTPRKLKRRSSIIPFGFVDIEAIESDGDGGDVDNTADDDGFMSDHGMLISNNK